MSNYAPYSPQSDSNSSSPPLTIVLTVTLLVFLFVGFFTVYFCRCFMENIIDSMNTRNSPSGSAVGASIINQGLDPSLIQAFPTFSYSTVKDFHREKYGLECAICLAEFEDDNMLRLLSVCCHVFHRECIDLWLSSHKTCPVCRRNLDYPQTFEKSPGIVRSNSMNDVNGSNASLEDAVSIAIKEDDDEESREENAEEGAPPPSSAIKLISERNEMLWQKFSRSHSTGHSMPRSRQGDDRFTLILPEHVTIKLLRRYSLTNSCIPFGDYSRTPTRNPGFGEAPGCSSVGESNRV